MSDDEDNFEMDWSQLKTIKAFDTGKLRISRIFYAIFPGCCFDTLSVPRK